jgi:hypothetical protein
MLPKRRVSVVAMAFAVALSMSPRADAGTTAQTVVVKNTGSATVRVRVFTSETSACDTGHQLFAGAVPAGEGVAFDAPSKCVCAEQTYADADDAPWTVPARFCRPEVCTGVGHAKTCEPAPDPVIRIDVDETPGK